MLCVVHLLRSLLCTFLGVCVCVCVSAVYVCVVHYTFYILRTTFFPSKKSVGVTLQAGLPSYSFASDELAWTVGNIPAKPA